MSLMPVNVVFLLVPGRVWKAAALESSSLYRMPSGPKGSFGRVERMGIRSEASHQHASPDTCYESVSALPFYPCTG